MRSSVICKILFLIISGLNSCKKEDSNKQSWKEQDLASFTIKTPSQCSLMKYPTDEGLSGEIACSKSRLYYEFGSWVKHNLPTDSSIYSFYIDTVNHVIRTIVWPKSKGNGSIILKLDDRNPNLVEDELRQVRELKMVSLQYDPGDVNVILSIYKSVRLK